LEIEAKFSIPDEQTFEHLLSATSLAGFELGEPSLAHLHDLYLDTARHDILAAGYACRLRHTGDGYMAVVKGLGKASGAIHHRVEHTICLDRPLYPQDWPSGPIRDMVLEICGPQTIQPLVDIEQDRHSRVLREGDRVVAELSLDRVSLIRDDSVAARYLELEAELLPDGSEQDLDRLTAEMEAAWGLEAEGRSKFERALALLGARQPEADKGQTGVEPRLTPDERAIVQRLVDEREVIARRARMLLAWDAGLDRAEVSRRAGLSPRRVRHWLHLFRQRGMSIFPAGLVDTAATGSFSERTTGAEAAEQPCPAEEAATQRSMGIGPVCESTETTGGDGKESLPAGDLPPSGLSVSVTSPAPQPAREELPRTPGIDPDDPMSEAGRKIIRFHFLRMLYHESGTRADREIEPLHDMRVATRRMRAAFRVFEDYFEPKSLALHLKGLRRAGRTLGAVRDLDVFRDKTLRYIESLPGPERESFEPFLGELQRQRQSARESLLTYLDSEKYARFLRRFDTFVHTEGLGSRPATPDGGEPRAQRVRHVAPMAVYERLAAVRAYDEWVSIPSPSLAHLHALRIACKRLRYTLEFFTEVLGPDTRALIKEVVVVQDYLGDLQDAVVASGILRDFLMWGTWGNRAAGRPAPDASEPVIAPGVACYLAAKQLEIHRLMSSFTPLWQRINAVEFSRQVAEAVSVL